MDLKIPGDHKQKFYLPKNYLHLFLKILKNMPFPKM